MTATKCASDLVAEPAKPADRGFVRNYLLYLLAAASDGVSTEFHALIRARGVRVPEWRVLACLADEEGQMVTQLAALALMEQSRLTKIIDQMAEKDLVSRRSDQRDRRRVRVYLTKKGRKLAAELIKEARAHEAGIIEQISPDQAEILKGVLARIIDLHGPEARAGDRPSAQTIDEER
jgi:DNA-binding MarR family transcriptional regulator